MKVCCHLFAFVAWLALAVDGTIGSAHGDELLDEIVAAWQERTDQFSAIDCHWTEAKTCLAGGPEQNATPVIRHYRMMFTAAGARLSRQGPQWHPLEKKYLELPYDCGMYQGEFRELMQGDYEQLAKFPQGYVTRRGPLQSGGMNLHFWPMILAFRPLDISLNGIDPRQCSVELERTTLDGHSCTVLSRSPIPQQHERYWLDVDNGFVVRRFELVANGNPVMRLEIVYDEDPRGRRPVQWTYTSFVDGSPAIRTVTQSKIDTYEVPDAKSQDWVQVIFPARTVIINRDTAAWHLVRDNGKWRAIDPEEGSTGVSYDAMLTTDPPSTWARTRILKYGWLGLGGIALACAIAGIGVALVRKIRMS